MGRKLEMSRISGCWLTLGALVELDAAISLRWPCSLTKRKPRLGSRGKLSSRLETESRAIGYWDTFGFEANGRIYRGLVVLRRNCVRQFRISNVRILNEMRGWAAVSEAFRSGYWPTLGAEVASNAAIGLRLLCSLDKPRLESRGKLGSWWEPKSWVIDPWAALKLGRKPGSAADLGFWEEFGRVSSELSDLESWTMSGGE